MNLKIQKFAEGGTSSSAFFYQPLAMATTGVEAESDTAKLIKAMTAANKKSSNDEDKGKITDKDFLGLLKDINGLPSDILKLYTQAQNFWADPTNTGDTNYSNFAQMLTRISLQAKIAKFNKEVWDKSRDTMFTNHSENEMAITDQGGVVIQTSDGGIDTISVEKWKQNPYAYKTLTNADIMELRAQKLPGDNSILNIVNGSTSVEAITDKLQKILSNAQSSSVSSYISTDGFNTKSGLTVLKGLLQRGLDPTTLTMPGVYKYTTKENADQVANLLQYAWASLSTKEQTLLTARAGKNKKGVDYLLKLLATGNTSFNTDMEYQDQLNPDGTKKDAKTGKSGSSSESQEGDWEEKAEANPAFMIQNGIGGQDSTYQFRPDSSSAMMTLYGQKYGDIKDVQDKKTIQSTSLADMLSRSGLQGISDTRAIYFGDKRVEDPDKLKDIVYLNQGGMRVNLPAKSDNYGNKVPDFELIPKYEQAMKEIRNIQTTDPKAYLIREAQILKKYGLSDLVDSKGFPNKDRFGAFLVVDGQASSDAVGNPTLATTVSNMDADFESMSKILYPDGKGGSSQKTSGSSMAPFGWFNSNIYKAPVYIPLDNNPVSTMILTGKVTPNMLSAMETLYRAQNVPINNTSSNVLNN